MIPSEESFAAWLPLECLAISKQPVKVQGSSRNGTLFFSRSPHMVELEVKAYTFINGHFAINDVAC